MELEHVTVPKPEPNSAATNLGPVLTASAPSRLEPVLFGAASDFFMHSIVFNTKIEMNSVIYLDPIPVPGPKISPGSEQSRTVP
jgi:hypothetical protein